MEDDDFEKGTMMMLRIEGDDVKGEDDHVENDDVEEEDDDVEDGNVKDDEM